MEKVSVETSICETNGSGTGATITFEHTGRLANQTYSYKVFASNGSTATDANTQDESDTDVGSTGDPVNPSPVTDLTAIQDEATSATEKGNAVFLYWIKPESNGGQMIFGYRLHISKNNRDWPRLTDATETDDLPGDFATTGTANAVAIQIVTACKRRASLTSSCTLSRLIRTKLGTTGSIPKPKTLMMTTMSSPKPG